MGHSLPRSPRATITAPDASIISARSSTASLVSIFATTKGPVGCGSSESLAKSDAERTNDNATMSTSISKNLSSACKSHSVGAEIDNRLAGM